MRKLIILFSALLFLFCGSCKDDKPPVVVNTGYDSTLFMVIKAKQQAHIANLEHELDSMKAIEAKPNTKYVYLTKFVSADSSQLYQLNLMSGLLTLHNLRDSVVDTTGTILQRGNKRLIDYFAARDQLGLKDNIIKVQNSINRSLKEQIALDSADRRNCVDALKTQTDKHLEASMQLEACREDNKAVTKKRNGWRIATLALVAKDAIRLLLRN